MFITKNIHSYVSCKCTKKSFNVACPTFWTMALIRCGAAEQILHTLSGVISSPTFFKAKLHLFVHTPLLFAMQCIVAKLQKYSYFDLFYKERVGWNIPWWGAQYLLCCVTPNQGHSPEWRRLHWKTFFFTFTTNLEWIFFVTNMS